MSILVTKNKPTISTMSDTRLNETRLTKVHDFWEPKPKMAVGPLTPAAELVAAISVLDFYNQQTEAELGEYRSKMKSDLAHLGVWGGQEDTGEALPLPCLVSNHRQVCQFLGSLVRLQLAKQQFYQVGQEKLAKIEDLAVRVRQDRYHTLSQLNELKIRNICNYRQWADPKSANELRDFLTRELMVLVDLESQKNEILSVQLSKIRAKKSTAIFKDKFRSDTLLKTTGSLKAATMLLTQTEEISSQTEKQIKKIENDLKKSEPEKKRLEKEKSDLQEKIRKIEGESTDIKSKINKFDSDFDKLISDNPTREIRIFQAMQKRIQMKEEAAEDIRTVTQNEHKKSEKLKKKLGLISDREKSLKNEIAQKKAKFQSLVCSTEELETESKLAIPQPKISVSQISRSLKEIADTKEEGERKFDDLRHQFKQEAMCEMAKYASANQLLKNKIEYAKSLLEARLKNRG